MRSLLIATLAAAGLATCACSSLGGAAPQATGPAPAVHAVTVQHHRRHHHRHPVAVTAASQGPAAAPASGKPVTQIGQAAVENPATPRQLVTLSPGGVANALLRIVDAGNYPARKCAPVTSQWLQIFPPNQTVPIYLHYTSQACAKPVKLLTVNVVVPGPGG
jgi:hypothetical protein